VAISFVQSAVAGSGNSAAQRSLAYSSNVAAGNLLVVAISTFGTSITMTVVDTQGNTYAQAGSYGINGSNRVSFWYAVAGSSGANTVQVTPSAAAFMGLGVLEYSGAPASSPLDATSTNSGSTLAVSTGTVAVNGANELLLGCFGEGQGTYTFSPDAGFTTRCSQLNGNTNEALVVIEKIGVSASAAATGAWAGTSSVPWPAVGASFKVAAAGGGPFPWFFDSSMSGGLQPLGGF